MGPEALSGVGVDTEWVGETVIAEHKFEDAMSIFEYAQEDL